MKHRNSQNQNTNMVLNLFSSFPFSTSSSNKDMNDCDDNCVIHKKNLICPPLGSASGASNSVDTISATSTTVTPTDMNTDTVTTTAVLNTRMINREGQKQTRREENNSSPSVHNFIIPLILE
jgi:hypothetical protein